MDLFSKNKIKTLLDNYGLKPSKGLGQNFLINKRVMQKIIDSAELKPTDTVLEIGPGIGNLTQELAKIAKKVIAIEKDAKMAEILKETLKDYKNVEVVVGDVLKINLNNQARIPKKYPKTNNQADIGNWDFFRNSCLGFGNYKVVANLPYYITSPVIRKFLEADVKPELIVLMVQKEVAQRICARPHPAISGKRCGRAKPPRMNLLAVSVQFYAEPKIISYIKKENFWPRPKVDSAIIKIKPLPSVEGRSTSPEAKTVRHRMSHEIFFHVVKAGFSQPRKQLGNNLSKMLALSLPNGVELNKEAVSKILKENNIEPTRRAETLKIEDWINLSKRIKK